jgi:hypothetical protein
MRNAYSLLQLLLSLMVWCAALLCKTAAALQLIDFGLTKHIESARTMLVGTPGEMHTLAAAVDHKHPDAMIASAEHTTIRLGSPVTAGQLL